MCETSCNVLTFPYILGPTQLDMNKPRVLHIFINILSILLVQMLYSHKYPRIVLYEPFYTNNMMMIIVIDSLAHAIFYNHPFDPRTQANEFQFLFCLKQLKHNNYKTHDVHIYITKIQCTCLSKVSMFFHTYFPCRLLVFYDNCCQCLVFYYDYFSLRHNYGLNN